MTDATQRAGFTPPWPTEDLVKRLRGLEITICHEAAGDIDRLKEVNAELLAALEVLVEDYEGAGYAEPDDTPTALSQARAAITGTAAE